MKYLVRSAWRSSSPSVVLSPNFHQVLCPIPLIPPPTRGGRVVRWCWVNFQYWGVLLIWVRVGQGPTALAVGAGGGCLDIFSLVCHFSFLSPSLWETAQYRLKYCLKGPLTPKQPTNQPHQHYPPSPSGVMLKW